MNAWAEFSMCGPVAQRIVEELPHSGPGWSLNVERSEHHTRMQSSEIFILASKGGPTFPAVTITLVKEEGCYSAANVNPQENGQLTKAQYCEVLLDFYEKNVKPREGPGLTASPPRVTRDISEFLDENGVALFKAAASAFKFHGGNLHRLDQMRWHAFVSHSFRHNQLIGPDLLTQALVEQGWPEEAARGLAGEYGTFIDLLSVYSGHDPREVA